VLFFTETVFWWSWSWRWWSWPLPWSWDYWSWSWLQDCFNIITNVISLTETSVSGSGNITLKL